MLVTVVLDMGLIGLGLAAGKVGLPFDFSLERHAPAASSVAIEVLVADLKALREADERAFEQIGRLAAPLAQNVERVTLLERRIVMSPTTMSTATSSESLAEIRALHAAIEHDRAAYGRRWASIEATMATLAAEDAAGRSARRATDRSILELSFLYLMVWFVLALVVVGVWNGGWAQALVVVACPLVPTALVALRR